MTDQWIDATIGKMQDSDDPDTAQLGFELEDAVESGVEKELVVVQNDEQIEKTVLPSLTGGDMDIDRVHIVKLERVIE